MIVLSLCLSIAGQSFVSKWKCQISIAIVIIAVSSVECVTAADELVVDCCIERLLFVMLSDYQHSMNMTDIVSDVVSGPIGDKAVSAVWQLALALLFKMIVTVFTFGIKVCDIVVSCCKPVQVAHWAKHHY